MEDYANVADLHDHFVGCAGVDIGPVEVEADDAGHGYHAG